MDGLRRHEELISIGEKGRRLEILLGDIRFHCAEGHEISGEEACVSY